MSETAGFVSETLHNGPSCSKCGATMVAYDANGTAHGTSHDPRIICEYKCLSCGNTTGVSKTAMPTPWMREAAKELVEANADRGRTYDNAPDYLQTAEIIAKHAPQPDSRAALVEAAQELLDWVPVYSVGSAGYQCCEKLRAALNLAGKEA